MIHGESNNPLWAAMRWLQVVLLRLHPIWGLFLVNFQNAFLHSSSIFLMPTSSLQRSNLQGPFEEFSLIYFFQRPYYTIACTLRSLCILRLCILRIRNEWNFYWDSHAAHFPSSVTIILSHVISCLMNGWGYTWLQFSIYPSWLNDHALREQWNYAFAYTAQETISICRWCPEEDSLP